MIFSEIQLLAQLVAERALNSICGGLLIAVFAWLVLRVVGKQNSGTRFAVWFSALIAIAGLPFVRSLSSAAAMKHAMRAEIMLPGVWAVALLAVWILVAVLTISRMLLGFWNLRRLRRSGVALATSMLNPALRETIEHCQGIRPVTVCCSSKVMVPTAIGFFQPVILIPEWALQELPAKELKVILLHEFAHLRRWDDWTNFAQKILRTLFFFHPAVWWIEKRLSLEREMACDDAVLAETKNPRAYAECLVSLAEKNFVQRSLAMAQAAISRASETSARLAQILDAERPHSTRLFKPALGLMTAFAGVCLLLLPNTPKLIAFEDGVQPRSFANASETLAQGTQASILPVTVRTRVDSAESMTNKALATPAVYRPSRSVEFKLNRLNYDKTRSRWEGSRSPFVTVPVAARQIEPVTQFVLVMQRAEFDEQGSVILTVSVWRVTFAQPHGNGTQQQVTAKAI